MNPVLARGVLMAMAWLVVACGGHTEGGTGDAPESAQGASGSSAGNDRNGSSPKVEGDTLLGECTLGFSQHRPEGRSCTWLADALCYESRDMACNCICPRSRDSQCFSGFEEGPDGRVEVFCE
jgi:hypothetical protein